MERSIKDYEESIKIMDPTSYKATVLKRLDDIAEMLEKLVAHMESHST